MKRDPKKEQDFFDYVQKIEFSTEPTNKLATEVLLRQLCELRKLSKPVIEWVDSPVHFYSKTRTWFSRTQLSEIYADRTNMFSPTAASLFYDRQPNGDPILAAEEPFKSIVRLLDIPINMQNSALVQIGGYQLDLRRHALTYIFLYEYAKLYNIKLDVHKIVPILIDLRKCAGPIMMDDWVFLVSERPEVWKFDDRGNIGSRSGPALKFRDGSEFYYWRNIRVPDWSIIDPDHITAEKIHKIENTEVRTAIAELLGAERFMDILGAKLEHKDEFGELYIIKQSRIRRGVNFDLKLVKVINSTPEPDGTFKAYYLYVPPTVQTAKEGVASTFGIRNVDDYNPLQQT